MHGAVVYNVMFLQSTSDYYYNSRCLYSSYSSQSSSNTTHSDEDLFPSDITVKPFEWPKGLNLSYLPTEVDWRTMGAVSDVKDQVGLTGFEYVFSITIVNYNLSMEHICAHSLEEHTNYCTSLFIPHCVSSFITLTCHVNDSCVL